MNKQLSKHCLTSSRSMNHPEETRNVNKTGTWYFYGHNYRDISFCVWISQVALVVKNPPANAGDNKRCRFDPWVGEDPLEEDTAIHSSFLVWRILQTGEPGGPWSIGSQRVQHSWRDFAWTHSQSKGCTHIQFLEKTDGWFHARWHRSPHICTLPVPRLSVI